jgi:hypothetical protein
MARRGFPDPGQSSEQSEQKCLWWSSGGHGRSTPRARHNRSGYLYSLSGDASQQVTPIELLTRWDRSGVRTSQSASGIRGVVVP